MDVKKHITALGFIPKNGQVVYIIRYIQATTTMSYPLISIRNISNTVIKS